MYVYYNIITSKIKYTYTFRIFGFPEKKRKCFNNCNNLITLIHLALEWELDFLSYYILMEDKLLCLHITDSCS